MGLEQQGARARGGRPRRGRRERLISRQAYTAVTGPARVVVAAVAYCSGRTRRSSPRESLCNSGTVPPL
ncbi:hypothetical protein RHCRD62_80232 [Rhodococcus sp. RD6.2]|nr:hypothetical protein RHCRD62_80232 [Rhodococcus sp. RD6.2]